MRNRRYLLFMLFILMVLCACSIQEEIGVEIEDQSISDSKVETIVEGDNYILTLPQGCLAEGEENGDVMILLEEKVVGGVTWLPYDSLALSLSLDDIDFSNEVFANIIAKLSGGAQCDYSYSGSLYGDFQLSLSIDAQEENHYFFCCEDALCDLWLKQGTLSWEQEKTILTKFVAF